MIGAIEAPKRLEAPKVVLGPDPKMGGWKSLGESDVDTPREPVLDEDGEAWTPEAAAEARQAMRARRRGRR